MIIEKLFNNALTINRKLYFIEYPIDDQIKSFQ